MIKLMIPPPDTSPPSDGAPDGAVLDLQAYRDRHKAEPLQRTLRVVAVGPDKLRTERVYGDRVEVLYTLDLANMRKLRRLQSKAMATARDWDAGSCRACGKKACPEWHEGLVLERYALGSPRFSCLGFTDGGRVRLRSMATGKLTYSTSRRPHSWGRVVGWVDVVPTRNQGRD